MSQQYFNVEKGVKIGDNFVETDDESKSMPMEYPMEEITPKTKTHNYRRRKKPPPEFDITFKGEEFSLPPEGADEMTPLNYFKIFWSDDIINLLVEQTNLYSVQQTGSSINTNKSEMEQFIEIQMLMSIVSLPAYYTYWVVDTKYSPIADMSINRYKKCVNTFIALITRKETLKKIKKTSSAKLNQCCTWLEKNAQKLSLK